MRVYVKLFALLRQHHPGPNRSEPLVVELPEGATAGALVPTLNLPEKLVRHAFINNQQKTLDTPLADGDQVSLFPPVTGGAGRRGRPLVVGFGHPVLHFGHAPVA